MIVVDASVLIAHLDDRDAQHEQAVDRLLAAAAEALGANALTLAEVFAGPARRGRLDDAQAAIAALAIEEIPLASGAAGELATSRAETGLKLPDCCVLLAARNAASMRLLLIESTDGASDALARPDTRLACARPLVCHPSSECQGRDACAGHGARARARTHPTARSRGSPASPIGRSHAGAPWNGSRGARPRPATASSVQSCAPP